MVEDSFASPFLFPPPICSLGHPHQQISARSRKEKYTSLAFESVSFSWLLSVSPLRFPFAFFVIISPRSSSSPLLSYISSDLKSRSLVDGDEKSVERCGSSSRFEVDGRNLSRSFSRLHPSISILCNDTYQEQTHLDTHLMGGEIGGSKRTDLSVQ